MEKGTSLLFPPVDKVIQVYNCRLVNFSYCTGKSKRTQKYIKCRDDCVGTVCSKLTSVYVDTDPLQTPPSKCGDCHSEITKIKVLDKGKMYGTDDTTQMRESTLIKGAKFSNKGKQYGLKQKKPKKKYRRRRRDQVSRAVQINKKPIHLKTKKEGFPTKSPKKHATFDRKSLISLYRNRRHPTLNKNSVCPCSQKTNLETLEEIIKDGKKQVDLNRHKIQLGGNPNIDKGKVCNYNNLAVSCYKGICSKSTKNKDKDFVCTCDPKKEPAVLCSDNTCRKKNITANKSSFLRLKDKVSDLCHKSMLRRSRQHDCKKICEQGVCKEASQRHNPNISCTCKEKIKQCSNETCTSTKNKVLLNKSTPSRRLTIIKQKVQNKLRKKSNLNRENVCPNVIVQDETEQTGDPYFEIKVDAIDMCVLNPLEIKGKVMTLGEEKKRSKCVCPSHAVRKQYILEREACLGGTCQKALKNKKYDYSCKCLKNKIWTCNDITCNKTVTFRGKSYDCTAEEPSSKIDGKPLFEVRVDNDQMCIINTEEMRDKLDDIHYRRNKLCQSGICKEKFSDRNTRIICKCTKIMDSKECTENTCGDTKKRAKRQHKTIRNNFDTASIKNIKSKFSLYCSQMCSRSDNPIERNKRKKRTRTSKIRNAMTRTQSENVHKRGGLKFKWTRHGQEGPVRKLKTESNGDSIPEPKTNKKSLLQLKFTAIKNKSNREQKLKEDERTKNMNAGKNINDELLKKEHTKHTKTKRGVIETNNQISTKPKKQDNSMESNRHKRKGLILPVLSSKTGTLMGKATKKKSNSLCMCYHECTCREELEKRRLKQKYRRNSKQRSQSKRKPKKNIKKKRDRSEEKRWARESYEKKRKYEKEKKKHLKQEEARHRKRKKEEHEVLKLLESKDGARRSNCFVEILSAVLSAVGSAVKVVLYALFKVLTKPKVSFRFMQERYRDPKGTWTMITGTIRDGWRIRKMKICKCFKNSETASILSDTFKEGTLYQTFADKGKTKKEQQIYEIESKARKKRVLKRQREALYGCRHVLLTTLRKTPCLWVYHVCPECYPQCLSLLGMVKQFWHICLFVAALACWTPCIVACELSRALMCCLLCTG